MGNPKLSQDFIENHFSEAGCKLLDVYVNNFTPMKYICSCGKESTICWISFRKGSRCVDCKGNKIRNLKQLSYEYVKKYFSDTSLSNGILSDILIKD